MFVVQLYNRPTIECQVLSTGKLELSTGRENHTLTSSACFVLELIVFRGLFRQPGLSRKDPQMAVSVKLISKFFIYILSKE